MFCFYINNRVLSLSCDGRTNLGYIGKSRSTVLNYHSNVLIKSRREPWWHRGGVFIRLRSSPYHAVIAPLLLLRFYNEHEQRHCVLANIPDDVKSSIRLSPRQFWPCSICHDLQDAQIHSKTLFWQCTRTITTYPVRIGTSPDRKLSVCDKCLQFNSVFYCFTSWTSTVTPPPPPSS